MSLRLFTLAAASVLALAGVALAHPATEQFIPIGQTPGRGAVQGRAQAVAEPSTVGGAPVVTIASNSTQTPFQVGPHTRIYIDRSAQHLPNLVGALSDVQPGRIVEARVDPATHMAEWIKVRP